MVSPKHNETKTFLKKVSIWFEIYIPIQFHDIFCHLMLYELKIWRKYFLDGHITFQSKLQKVFEPIMPKDWICFCYYYVHIVFVMEVGTHSYTLTLCSSRAVVRARRKSHLYSEGDIRRKLYFGNVLHKFLVTMSHSFRYRRPRSFKIFFEIKYFI